MTDPTADHQGRPRRVRKSSGRVSPTADVVDGVVRQYRITGQAAVTQLVAAEATYCPAILQSLTTTGASP